MVVQFVLISLKYSFWPLASFVYVLLKNFLLNLCTFIFLDKEVGKVSKPPPPPNFYSAHTYTHIYSHTHTHMILWENINCLSFTSFTLRQSWFPHLFCLSFFYSFFRTYLPSSSHILISNYWRTQGHIISGSMVLPSVTFQESNSQLHVLLLYH